MRRVIAACLFLCQLSCSGEPASGMAAPDEDSFQQWALPDRLREISGLALTSDERLLAVADEFAVVYEIDYESGRLVKAFALGEPAARGDFEGIAVLDETVWLMTSDGVLYAAAEGGNGDIVSYDRYDTGFGKKCELEGLASIGSRGSLILACKQSRTKKKKLRVFEWSRDGGKLAEFVLPAKIMEKAVGRKHLRPSGIAVDPRTGDYLVAAAAQHAIFRIGSDGRLAGAIMRLNKKVHRQAEGIVLTRDGRLLIADEAAGGTARLAVYRTNKGNNDS